LEYFNTDDYWVNAFDDDDYVKMNAGAKEKIRKAVEGGQLIQAAKEQGNDVMEIIRFIAEGAGYTLDIVDTKTTDLIKLDTSK